MINCTVLQELQNKTWMSRYLINNHVRWCCQVETLCQLHLSEITKLAESFHLYQSVLLQVTLQLYFSMIIQKLWAKDSMAFDRDSGLMVMYLFWRPQRRANLTSFWRGQHDLGIFKGLCSLGDAKNAMECCHWPWPS